MVADTPYRLAFVFRPFATLSPLATLIPRRFAAFTIFLRAVSFLVPDSKSVWLNLAMAFRTWASSLIGRWPSPSLSTYANLRLSIFSRSVVSSSAISDSFVFLLGGLLHTLFRLDLRRPVRPRAPARWGPGGGGGGPPSGKEGCGPAGRPRLLGHAAGKCSIGGRRVKQPVKRFVPIWALQFVAGIFVVLIAVGVAVAL